jgi:hypothetical protein
MAKTGEKKVSQKAMVMAALEKFGWEAKPGDMQGFIKETYGSELPPNIISNYKSQIKREGGKTRGRTRRGGGGAGAGLDMQDFKAVADLVRKLGAERVREMVDVIG